MGAHILYNFRACKFSPKKKDQPSSFEVSFWFQSHVIPSWLKFVRCTETNICWDLVASKNSLFCGEQASKPQLNRGDGIIQPEELDFDAVQRLLKEQPGSRTALKRSQKKLTADVMGEGVTKLNFYLYFPLLVICFWGNVHGWNQQILLKDMPVALVEDRLLT